MENHYIQMEDKKRITITEVMAVEAFDEEAILADLAEDGLVISGKNLHIEMLDLEAGKLIAVGEIQTVSYTKKKAKVKITDRFRRK